MAGWLRPGSAALVVLVLVACGDSSGPGGGGGSATLSGTVRTAGGAGIVEDAIISVGARQATSDASGHFELAGLPVGAATVQAQRTGYLPAQATVTINAGANTHDFTLTEQEIYTSGPTAVYVPAGVGPLRGAIIALGGPNTSGFVTGGVIAPPNSPGLEQSLQALGASLRAPREICARGAARQRDHRHEQLKPERRRALRRASQRCRHSAGTPKSRTTPVLMFGLSAGAREAAGLASRHPERAIGLLVRVPVTVSEPHGTRGARRPDLRDAGGTRRRSEQLHGTGSLLGKSIPGWPVGACGRARGRAPRRHRSRATRWRLAGSPRRSSSASRLHRVTRSSPWTETSGWLGDQTTLEIAPWATFSGDPTAASWLLSPSVASSWKALGTPTGGTP